MQTYNAQMIPYLFYDILRLVRVPKRFYSQNDPIYKRFTTPNNNKSKKSKILSITLATKIFIKYRCFIFRQLHKP